MEPPRMPRWFRPVWDWSGRADDLLGRLRVLRNAALLGFAAFVILGVLLLDAVGPWGSLAILVALVFAAFAVVDEVIARRTPRAASNGTTGSTSPTGHLHLRKVPGRPEEPEEIVNADWDTSCSYVPATLSQPFGRGVVLTIRAKLESELDLRCMVMGPDGSRFECVSGRAFGIRARNELQAHFPGEFQPKPPEPWPVGYYVVRWVGDSTDIAGDLSTVELGQRWFRVDEDGSVMCSSRSP